VRLIKQPGDDIAPLLQGIAKAKKSVEIVIFRFDRVEIERALTEAAERGVFVHALIAFTNHGGEAQLRKLEMRLLDKGISVARTAGDLVRYHGKMIVIDRRVLYLLSFNFTHLDIEHSRSFGLITTNAKLVQEAVKLFEADCKRQPYVAGYSKFAVSPVNARQVLTGFIRGAKRELLIYDPEISDREMLHALQERAKGGVEIRIIGKVSRNQLPARTLQGLRLHTRSIIRDQREMFLGSQSLRRMELDSRREIGIIFRNPSVISSVARTFAEDWANAQDAKKEITHEFPVRKAARKMAKVVSKSLPVAPVVREVVKAIQRKGNLEIGPEEVEETVKTAVKEAVKDSVKDATKQVLKTVINSADLRPEDSSRTRT